MSHDIPDSSYIPAIAHAPADVLYFPPSTSSLLADVGVPIILTEGKTNPLALDSVARRGLNGPSDQPSFLALGLPANWHTSVSAVPGLDRIKWKNDPAKRPVVLAFDRSAYASERLRSAMVRLADNLRDCGAEVGIFAWPTNPVEPVTVAQLLARVGVELFKKLLGALSNAGVINVDLLAKALVVCDQFAKDAGGLIYRFEDGVYKPTGESFVKSRLKSLMVIWGFAADWTSRMQDEVAEFIRVDARELWQAPPPTIINVRNGLLNILDRELGPHSPEHLSSIQLPVVYDPDAVCPACDKFVSEVFPPDARQVAWELPAWLMSPDTSIQKAMLLLGEGANGKSTYLALILAFLGKHNTTAISLQKLENDRFAAARLVGKLANICPDLPSVHLTSTSTFKALTGGDTSTAERKYRDSFEFVPFAKLIFSANHPPRSDDSSHAFFRRWMVIPFTRVFEDGAKGTLPRSELDALLCQPGELSGLLNHALDAVAGLRKSGFSMSKSTREAWEQFRRETDPFAVWLDKNIVDDPSGYIPKGRLFDLYAAECQERRRPPLTSTAFGLALKRLRKVVQRQRTVAGKEKVWCYVGIRGPSGRARMI